jgi:hypothetical protein
LNLLKKYKFVLLRSFGFVFAGLIVLSVNDCEAQLIRGRWQRVTSNERDVVSVTNPPIRSNWNSVVGGKPWFNSKTRNSDRWPRPVPWNVESNNSRYIGGFHYSYFENLGIPSGDIGLRGNGVNWRPW